MWVDCLVLLLQQAQSRHGTNSKQLVLWWAIQLLCTSCKPPQSTVLPHSGETVSLLSLLLHIHTRPGTNDPSLYAILNILYSYSPYSSPQTIFQPQYPFLLALANHCISLLNSSFTDLSLV